MEKRPRIPNYVEEKSFDWQYVFSLNRFIEIQQHKIEVMQISINEESGKKYCLCIDKCISKKENYYCRANRFCVNKTDK